MVVHPDWGYDEITVKIDGAHATQAILSPDRHTKTAQLLTELIAVLTISYHTFRSANANPVAIKGDWRYYIQRAFKAIKIRDPKVISRTDEPVVV